jgi:hypothetical protein
MSATPQMHWIKARFDLDRAYDARKYAKDRWLASGNADDMNALDSADKALTRALTICIAARIKAGVVCESDKSEWGANNGTDNS